MKAGKFLALAGLLFGFAAGCGSSADSAKKELEELKNKNKIDQISVENFVYCSQMGNRDAVHLYLKSGMDINVRNSEGRTPLMGAVAADPGSPWYDRNEEIFRFLMSKGANVNAVDNYGTSVLTLAKNLTRLRLVKILAEAGAIEYPNGTPTPTPLPEVPPQSMM